MLLAAAPAPAATDPAEVLAKLQSPEVRDRAWGAYLAGKEHVKAAIPFLVDRLREPAGAETDEGRHCLRNVFDALIRLDARVPREALAPWLSGGFRYPALILASRETPAFAEALESIFATQSGDRIWPFHVAIGNLLAASPPRGFALEVLKRIPLRLHVVVHDPGAPAGVGIGGRSSASFGDGRVRIPEGFPPWVAYDLTFEGEKEGATLLADGDVPVYSVRTERAEPGGYGSGNRSESARDCALGWMKKLLRAGADAAVIDPDRTLEVAWAGPDDYVRRVAAARDALLGDGYALLAECVKRGLVTAAKARALTLSVAVDRNDSRAERTPLPDLPESEVRYEPPEKPAPGDR